MRKFLVIATMVFSVAAMTACGNKDNKAGDEISNVPEGQNTDANNTEENNTQGNDENIDTNTNDEVTDADDSNTDVDTDDKNSSDGDSNNEDSSGEKVTDSGEEELIETGKKPDIKVNKKGCFNGSYEGSDGCIYKFTKKGKLTITSDSEVIEYIYQLEGDRLNLVTIDQSMGIGRQITLLEDGTYLLDDTQGNQVVLTYIEE